MELIERDAAIDTLEKHGVATDFGTHLLRHMPTIDPIHAAGGCYCRECRYYDEFDCPASSNGYTYLWVKYCGYGKPKEAQGDG